MIPLELKNEYYQALLDKNTEYEGLFYVFGPVSDAGHYPI